jgi:hypothetical protein
LIYEIEMLVLPLQMICFFGIASNICLTNNLTFSENEGIK